MSLSSIHRELKCLGHTERAIHAQKFFKTGPGEYGEGDQFFGVTVPTLRKLSQDYRDLSLMDLPQLLQSPYHEARLLALFIMVRQFQKGDENQKKVLYDLYVRSRKYINNWDLVDSSAEHIVGAYLSTRSRKPLYAWAHSRHLWSRRIAMMATFHFIKKKDFVDALRLADILLHDSHDLIQKAVGWMLREIGNRHRPTEESFLKMRYKDMPRTMLRYAIEKFPAPRRKRYLEGTI